MVHRLLYRQTRKSILRYLITRAYLHNSFASFIMWPCTYVISKILCVFTLIRGAYFILFNQADIETDEVYAQMTLQPLNTVRISSLLYYEIPYLPDCFLHFVSSSFSKSRRRCPFFQQIWVPPANSRRITSAKLWQQVTPVLMVDSQFLVVQLRKCSHPW